MVLRMNRPTKRPESRMGHFRKRTPKEILAVAKGQSATVSLPPSRAGEPPVIVNFKIGQEVKFSLRTEDKLLIAQRNAAATTQLMEIYSGILNGPRQLDQKEIQGLAGIAYRAFAENLERIATGPELWARMRDENQYAIAGSVIKLSAKTDAISERLARLAQLQARFGGFVDALLRRERLYVDDVSKEELLWAFARAIDEGCANLERKAKGDFSPDPVASRFPQWEPSAQLVAPCSAVPFDLLLSKWQAARDPAPGSIAAFKAAVVSLTTQLNHSDASRVTKADLRAWRDGLSERGLKAKTINNNYLTHIRTLFRLGVAEDLLSHDPSIGVRDERKQKAGERKLPYSDREVALILELADREAKPYLRWMPWLLALTGARVGEIAALWGTNIQRVDGIDIIYITPSNDGGTLKNVGSERPVPIHPAILQRGFLEFVKSRNSGPLFYGGEKATPRPKRENQKRHASKGPANRLASWIRQNGFDDPRKAPNHAFRHWFKSVCAEFGILDSQANLIQGHRGGGGEAEHYLHSRVKALYAAICKIVPPSIEGT